MWSVFWYREELCLRVIFGNTNLASFQGDVHDKILYIRGRIAPTRELEKNFI